MNLPKLYVPTKIRFSSLRNGIGENLGVIFDMDTIVERKCMRVLNMDKTWKWQIINIGLLKKYDPAVYEDEYILNEYGSSVDFEIVK